MICAIKLIINKYFFQLPDPLATEDTLEDLIGPELAGMVANPSVAQPVKNVPIPGSNSASNSASEMSSDISDLRSQDLLSTLSGVGVDIDRMFEEVSNKRLLGKNFTLSSRLDGFESARGNYI